MEMRCALNDLQDLKVTHDLDPYKGAACESSLEFRSSLLIILHLLIVFAVIVPSHLCSLKHYVFSAFN